MIFPFKKRAPNIFFVYTHNTGRKRYRYGLKANTEISYHVFMALKKAFKRVHFLPLSKAKLPKITQNDVVVGHIGETFSRCSQCTNRLIAFYPWAGHEDRVTSTLFNCVDKQWELDQWKIAKKVVLLTSEHNQATYLNHPKNFWYKVYQAQANKIRLVHQPVDLLQFQRIKTTYTTSNFLYVGNDAHMKCLNDSKQLVQAVKRTLHLFGIGEKRLDNLKASHLPLLADFFIQPGMWEGQCVAILEAAARGFIPLVSPETGYPYQHPYLLRYNDFDYNLAQLEKALKTTPQERKELADALYDQLKNDANHNNWDTLTKVVVDETQKLLPH